MPSSLRFVLLLFGLAAVSAPFSVYFIERQDWQQARVTAEALTGGNVDAGEAAAMRYGCGGCHQIPGVSGAQGRVGPSLKGVAVRTEIAGKLPNQPDKLMLWLRHPQAVIPGNGMPEMGVTDRDARDIAAYLYTLRK